MRVVTFGELMVRLQPFNYERFVQANNLEFSFGGGEANVAVSLANYGLDAAFVTKLPAHAIGFWRILPTLFRGWEGCTSMPTAESAPMSSTPIL